MHDCKVKVRREVVVELVILGGNGRLGREISRQAVAGGHRVVGVVRGADREVAPGVAKAVGDPCDPVFLRQLASGSDAVVSTLGPQLPLASACAVYPRSGRALAEALPAAGVRRLVVTSTGLLFPADTVSGRLLRWVLPNVAAHAGQMEASVRGAPLDWTVVRTDFLTSARERSCRIGVERLPQGGGAVSRSAVARVMLDLVENRRHIGGTLGVCGSGVR